MRINRIALATMISVALALAACSGSNAEDADLSTEPPSKPTDESFAAFLERMAEQDQVPVTVEEIASLGDDDELDSRIWGRLATVIDYRDAAQLSAQDPRVSAYLATRTFEWEVRNGGLHQYFFNFGDPDLFELVLSGYSTLGLDDTRRNIAAIVAPLAADEAAWRESLRDGNIETFMNSYAVSRLPEFDSRIGEHDADRVRLVRDNPAVFAR